MSNDHWGSPEYIIEAVRTFVGGQIALDPCSNAHSIVRAMIEWTGPPEGIDGLTNCWTKGGLVYVNPPYSQALKGSGLKDNLYRWSKKMAEEAATGSEIIALIKFDPSTQWFSENVWPTVSSICMLKKRVRHLPPPGCENMTPNYPSALFYWGKRSNEFYSKFSCLGYTINVSTIRQREALKELTQISQEMGLYT